MAPTRTPERGSHSSGTAFARCLTQPTRMTGPETGCSAASSTRVIPIRSCSRWGLPCRPCCQARGGLLPHPFTLTPPALLLMECEQDSRRGGFLSVALSLGSPPPDVIRHRISVEPGLSSPYRLSALVKRGCRPTGRGSLDGLPGDGKWRSNPIYAKRAENGTGYSSLAICPLRRSSEPSLPISSELLAAVPQPRSGARSWAKRCKR